MAYSPALDLSSCGKSIQDAQNRFENAVNLFLDEMEEMGTLDQVLRTLGWVKQSKPTQGWIPPDKSSTHLRYSEIPLHILKKTHFEMPLRA